MEPTIRAVEPDELSTYLRTIELGAGRRPGSGSGSGPESGPDEIPNPRTAPPTGRTYAAFDAAGHMVAGTSSDLLELTLPGPVTTPATRAGLTAVAPTHRGRGLAAGLLIHQMRACAALGETLLMATTSAPGLLRRVGYGPATTAAAVRVRLPAAPSLPPESGLRLLEPDEAENLLPTVFEQHRLRRPGQVARSPEFWRAWFRDEELYRIGPSERFVVVLEDDDGGFEGYITYRLSYGDLRSQPVEAVVVEDIVDVDAAARVVLWRFALSFSQARFLHAPNVATDEPLPWLLDDPRALRDTAVRDFLWLRILDVPRALATRRYASAGRLLIEVRDPLLAANAGTFAVEVDGPDVGCRRVSCAPELSVDIGDLATVFLGRTTFTTLLAAGRAVEQASGAALRGSLMFSSSPLAWTVTDW